MTTFLDYLVVLAVAALLLAPSLYGTARERRIDRQLRKAAAGRSAVHSTPVTRSAQKSSSRSTVPSTATW
ncbi:hypothetical protein [Streptomyces sp. NPDC048340]|uniref:hypothetical protein n=1 Tax=Streptomyces sp. NPDC048340 TaxID=3365537 RepID=UPI0037247DDB